MLIYSRVRSYFKGMQALEDRFLKFLFFHCWIHKYFIGLLSFHFQLIIEWNLSAELKPFYSPLGASENDSAASIIIC